MNAWQLRGLNGLNGLRVHATKSVNQQIKNSLQKQAQVYSNFDLLVSDIGVPFLVVRLQGIRGPPFS